jgi:hypothetical protein
MVATELQVVNQALGELNILPLASLAGTEHQAVLASSILADARDSLLRDHAWNFANREEELTATVVLDPEPRGFIYAYELPDDCVCARKIYPYGNPHNPIPFSIVYSEDVAEDIRPVLLTNIPEAYLQYTARIVDPGLWDAGFTRTMVAYMAFRLSVMKGDAGLRQQLFEVFQLSFQQAAAADGRERWLDVTKRSNPYLEGRL